MIIACPKCETEFSMPDAAYKPGRKARCSHCGNVFVMPARPLAASVETLPSLDKKPAPGKRNFRWLVVLLLCLCFVGIGYGGYQVYRAFVAPLSSPPSKNATAGAPGQKWGDAAKVKDITLTDVRQFVVDNDKLGKIVVVQGRAVNNFKTPKEFIVVEARLYDKEDKVLAARQQLCGVTLTLLQLQALDAAELTRAMDNRVEILTNNTNIRPGGDVPFVVVFPANYPDMWEFEVRPVDVRDPAAPGKK